MNSYILLVLFLIIMFILNNDREGFGTENSQSNEAIQHVSSLYNTENITVSNVNVTNELSSPTINATVELKSGKIGSEDGRVHIHGGELLYLLNKDGVIIGKEWGGNGNLLVQGDVDVGGKITSDIVADKNLTINGKLHSNTNKARYIKIGNSNSPFWRQHWSMVELEAYDTSGTNVAKNKTVTKLKGTAYNTTFIPQNITDGKVFNDNNFRDNIEYGYHGGNDQQQLQIDLGQEYYLNQIVVYGRYHGDTEHRMDGTEIELLDSNKTITRIIRTGMWHDGTYSKEYLLN